MFAIIETGGKQYMVAPKSKVKIEKLGGEAGSEVVFDKILLVADKKDAKIGKPYVKGAKVTAKVVKQGRSKKISMIRYRRKTRTRRRKGHRQPFTEVEITSIA